MSPKMNEKTKKGPPPWALMGLEDFGNSEVGDEDGFLRVMSLGKLNDLANLITQGDGAKSHNVDDKSVCVGTCCVLPLAFHGARQTGITTEVVEKNRLELSVMKV